MIKPSILQVLPIYRNQSFVTPNFVVFIAIPLVFKLLVH